MKKYLQLISLLIVPFILSGCILAEWISPVCSFVKDDHDKSHCYQAIGIYGNSTETCEKASSGGTRTKCFIKLAKRKKDGSYCEHIGKNEMAPNYAREECYQAIAVETNDAEYCEKMGDYKAWGNDISGGSAYSKEDCLASLTFDENENENENEDDEENIEEGECKYDSDCDSICEGNVYWKMGCNARTNTCEKTFDTDCSNENTNIGVFSFPKLCSIKSSCIDNKTEILGMKTALSSEAMQWNNLMQNIERARRQALDNCIDALSDVTSKFIIDSAVTFSSIAGLRMNTSYQSMAEFNKFIQPSGGTVSSLASAQVTGPVQQLLDTLGGIAVKDVLDTKPKMKVEKYIDLHCNAATTLKAEYDRLATERDNVITLEKPFKNW